MKTELKYRKMGLFDYNTLTVKFGGEKSIPKNIFTATAIKVPNYTIISYENESLGGGWYSRNKERIERKYENSYLIFRDDECIGWMMPYSANHNIKSELLPLEVAPKQVLDHLKNIDNETRSN